MRADHQEVNAGCRQLPADGLENAVYLRLCHSERAPSIPSGRCPIRAASATRIGGRAAPVDTTGRHPWPRRALRICWYTRGHTVYRPS
jgi:hypothetical protein